MDKALELLKSEGLTEEDITEIETKKPRRPDFPFLIFLLAVFKDLGDVIGLGIGGTVLNLISAPILFIYFWGKLGFIKKRFYKRLILLIVAEFIPGLNFIPFNTIFIVRSHLQEYEQIDKILNVLEGKAVKKFIGGAARSKIAS